MSGSVLGGLKAADDGVMAGNRTRQFVGVVDVGEPGMKFRMRLSFLSIMGDGRHLVTSVQGLLQNGRSDESRRADQCNLHSSSLTNVRI
jgi:hypothetical protein